MCPSVAHGEEYGDQRCNHSQGDPFRRAAAVVRGEAKKPLKQVHAPSFYSRRFILWPATESIGPLGGRQLAILVFKIDAGGALAYPALHGSAFAALQAVVRSAIRALDGPR